MRALVLGLLVGLAAAATATETLDYGATLKELERELKHDGKNIPARMAAAGACIGLEDPACAEKHLKWVNELAPDTPGYQLLLGRTQLLRANESGEQGDAARRTWFASAAADAFAKALVETPGDPRTLALRARALRASGRVEEARAAYDAWVAAAPRDPEPYGAAAAFLAATGMWSDADAILARAPQDDPALLYRLRLAMLENGVATVPWASIRPLFETVERDEPDAGKKRVLHTYHAILASEGHPSPMALLDYLDADPQDRFHVRTSFFPEGKPRFVKLPPAPSPSPDHPRAQLVEPSYPEVARRARMEGKVVLLARVLFDGQVGSAHVLWSSNPLFEDSAVAALRRGRFPPRSVDGKPVEDAILATTVYARDHTSVSTSRLTDGR